MNVSNNNQSNIKPHKPRWNFEGVTRKMAMSLDIEETVNKTPMMPNENKLKIARWRFNRKCWKIFY